MLRMQDQYSFGFYVADFLFRRIFRWNSGVKWPVHFTSTFRSPQNIVRGIGVWPGDSPGMYINANNGIYIGDFSNVAPNAGLISSNHDVIDNDKIIPGPPLRIGRFCWVGMGAIILPAVELGDFTVVGAGSVVTKSFPEGYCIIVGNPARKIKDLDKAECDAHAARKYAQAASK